MEEKGHAMSFANYGGKRVVSSKGAASAARCGAYRAVSYVEQARAAAHACMRRCLARMHVAALSRSGQGTTEYAILVGVLVVIAIVAITVFRPKIEELWNAIADGINGL